MSRERWQVFPPEVIAREHEAGRWSSETISDYVKQHAAAKPHETAFIADDAILTWRDYDRHATRLAAVLEEVTPDPNRPIAVLMPSSAGVHVTYLAAQRAGLPVVGIGPRAGLEEIKHLLHVSGARTLITCSQHRGRDATVAFAGLPTDLHLLVDVTNESISVGSDGTRVQLPPWETAERAVAGRGLGADHLFFLNSTSGTTGRPKCVMQTMNVRKWFGPLARRAGALTDHEVVLSVLPPPFGFGQWSAHVVPAMYGYTTVLAAEFSPEATLDLIEQHGVTVLAAVTTQFVMMLGHPAIETADLGTLRVLFTGGERVRQAHAERFERLTGATVLQFYGSNEAGPISVTTVSDSLERRLNSVGRPIPEAKVKLKPLPDRASTGARRGQCAVSGPGLTPGYFGDQDANARLFDEDGWMLTGDICELDDDGFLHVTGRVAEFIIRGGQNISVAAVEQAVGSHPRVANTAVVGYPDETFGERVCAFVVTDDGREVTLAEMREHLEARGVSKHTWPEALVSIPEMPLSVGAKTDRAKLREWAARRVVSSR